MAMQINVAARAKINLCLHVIGQEKNGYHLLDSIVVFSDYADQISIQPADQFTLQVKGPFSKFLGAEDDNLVLRAARLFKDHCKGAKIILHKNLPVASGIGGGSADAAATLLGMAKMTEHKLPEDNGLSLGADVPVCLLGKATRMEGIGEILTPVTNIPILYSVLVWPNTPILTSKIFRKLQSKNNSKLRLPSQFQNFEMFLSNTRNDLEPPAVDICPIIACSIQELIVQGAFFARMSGSGATCFGLFKDEVSAKNAANRLRQKYSLYWVKYSRLNVTGDDKISEINQGVSDL